MRLKDKVAIITGGSRGIGFATADKFLKEGATVILTASSQGSADKGGIVMKKVLLILLAVLLLAGCAAPAEGNGYRQISMTDAVTMMEEETGYIILDVRTPEEFAEKHIPGAINVPNEVIGAEEISELPDKDQLILVYCRSGNRSKQASEKLVTLGYTNIVEFGGINDWPGETVSGS